jgi:hypothetical protein
MINALEEAYLNGVAYDYNFQVHRVVTDGAVTAPPISEAEVRSLIPRFAQVVADLIERDWIEIREPHDGVWNNAAPMTAEQIAATLTDPDTWIWNEDGGRRMVMLMTTDRWDALFTK